MKTINFFTDLFLVFVASDASAWIIRNATETLTGTNLTINKSEMGDDGLASIPKSRRKRFGMKAWPGQQKLGQPPVFGNMDLLTFSDIWVKTSQSELASKSCSYRSILQLVKPWYDEVRDYAFPYPHDCNPRCPMRCYGPMCTHYTQMVWASSNRVGCAIQACYNMVVWGAVWREATYLVCNYSPKGNWIGEAPYRVGVPCSSCPPSYGGSCSNNMCFPAINSNFMYWFK
ncbi:peptidase inhibitor 15 isoform X2 [Rhinichthys klamathensis goyatoka]|uniref:peptidase inhibitor 15 isoform X2 n=1 Tax=Rhinichthys klamathensis goyatoka TaxID=3034132 RepID=UPI0024B5EFDF|nr:peptidase inhibitor 15 isoform X2 [Rhinichthys klamathensis goyatoka]